MTLTLEKTWRKDAWTSPYELSTHKHSNAWTYWAIKEMMQLGNNGVKAGPNAWTVVGSCDSTQFAMDTTDYLVDYTDCISAAGNHSWIVLKNAALGAGTGLELCLDFTDDTSYYRELTIAFSWSAGFTGGATDARPTATDEVEVWNKAYTLWPTTDASGVHPIINRLYSTDGEVCRFFVTSGSGVYLGILNFEKLKSPTAMVDKNFFVAGTRVDLTRANTSGVTNAFGAYGLHYGEIDGTPVRGRTSCLCQHQGTTGYNIYDQPYVAASDSDGLWITDKVKLWSSEATRSGLIGEVFDMHNIVQLTPFHLVAGAGGSKDFFSFGEFIWGNDGTVVDG